MLRVLVDWLPERLLRWHDLAPPLSRALGRHIQPGVCSADVVVRHCISGSTVSR